MARILLLVAALIGGIAGAADAANLRSQVVVEGDVVRLGDLFENPGPRAQVAVANAPAPGRRIVFEVQWLAEVARYYQVAWRPQNRFERVTVERPGRVITPSELVGHLRPALQARGMRQDGLIELAARSQDIAISLEAPDTVEVRQLDYDVNVGRFTAVIIVGAGHASQQRAILTGRVFPTVALPVLRRAFNVGEMIRAEDIDWANIREDSVRSDVVTDPAQLVGTNPRVRLRAGEPIRQGDTRLPVLVARNATVSIVLETGAMRITVLGRALDEGARGQSVRVTNLQSRQTIEAIVVGPDMVSVPFAGRVAFNAQ
ncbi:MAG: flagellar basal body P-ring formation protein FlgA [Alphaproteobacteria bacterium]|nr:flagellar basal body P-ring formation protein FlgA [Alphaproteobacteria bacterium]